MCHTTVWRGTGQRLPFLRFPRFARILSSVYDATHMTTTTSTTTQTLHPRLPRSAENAHPRKQVKGAGPDSFGNMATMTGSESSRNPFRFSTKYTDDETELVYYGHRYYSPETGRWMSRDPKDQQGNGHPSCRARGDCRQNIGLYLFCQNRTPNEIDVLGLMRWGKAEKLAGSKCCYICELESLEAYKERIVKILAGLRKPSPLLPEEHLKNLTSPAETRCTLMTIATLTINDEEALKSCYGTCILAHEKVHKDQCENHYSEYPGWTDPSPESTAQMEIPAYEATLECLNACIAKSRAERDEITSPEEWEIVCKCCKDSKLKKSQEDAKRILEEQKRRKAL